MAELIECTCLGNNPECFKCDGKGYIPRPESIHPIDQLARLASARRRAPSRRPLPSPARIKPPRPARPSAAQPPRATPPAKLPAVYTCACSLRVKASQKAAHDRCCPRRQNKRQKAKARPVPAPRPTYQCACGSAPLVKNKAKHAERCPARPPSQGHAPRFVAPPGPERVHADDVPRGDLERASVRDERRLDAVRGVGLVVRESGRYGSPSVYDRMDDESDA